MAHISGVDVVVALYEETTYGGGTQSSPSTKVDTGTNRLIQFNTLDINAEQSLIESPIIMSGRGTSQPGRGNLNVSGNIELTVAPNTIGIWLKHAMGKYVKTGTSTPYTHTFDAGAMPPGLTIEKDYSSKIASKVERLSGLRINQAEFNFAQEGFATARFSMIGKGHTIAAAPIASGMSLKTHAGFTGFEGVVKRSNSVIAGINALTIRIDNQMPGGPYCFPGTGETAGERRSNPEGKMAVSGSITTVFESSTLLDQAIDGSETNYSFEYSRGTGAGTAGNETLKFHMYNVMLSRRSPPITTPAGLELTLDFIAYSDTSPLTVTLVNGLATL